MPKRKAEEEARRLPDTIVQEPASTSGGTGPFVVYFPSRFDPQGSEPCEWQAYESKERKQQYVVVAKTVRRGSWEVLVAWSCLWKRGWGCMHATAVPPPPLPPLTAACHPPHPPACLQQRKVDFVGSTSSADYGSALPCRCVPLVRRPRCSIMHV